MSSLFMANAKETKAGTKNKPGCVGHIKGKRKKNFTIIEKIYISIRMRRKFSQA